MTQTVVSEPPPAIGLTLIEQLLAEQREATAVERFAQRHEAAGPSQRAEVYRDLLPLSAPRPGEQYAFEVDLDSCSGCKACVTACHQMNGLDADEAWRSVGLLHGGSSVAPVVQHVTTACHHCVDPACLNGCPVLAYEKDPLTGIVRHLDDQCIGCQYCMLKCPYDVPKYNARLGIVRKCDMCQQRLSVGEAPACVQACPNGAIRITLVERQAVIEASQASLFLPGAQGPDYTLPTTVYKTRRPLPRNLLPADYYSAAPQHAHWPLIVMLVLTQMAVGAFAVNQALRWNFAAAGRELLAQTGGMDRIAALALGLLGIGASVFHLGRPKYAYRAWVGLTTSWLSREILAFGLFAVAATVYAALALRPGAQLAEKDQLDRALGVAAVATGVLGILCSAMIYADTRRPFWSAPATILKFLLTATVVGIPTTLIVLLATAAWSEPLTVAGVMRPSGMSLCGALAAASTGKLLLESRIFWSLRDKQLTPLKRTARLMIGDLALTTMQRFFLGVVGGIALPMLLFVAHRGRPDAVHPLFVGFIALLMWLACLAGELAERYLFFTAVVAPKMPGSPAA